MEKLLELKEKLHEHSEVIGLGLEFILLVGALFLAMNKSLKKALSVYDKQKLKLVKVSGKADVKIQKLKNKETVKAAKRDLKAARKVKKLQAV